jgi:hypothetical protein
MKHSYILLNRVVKDSFVAVFSFFPSQILLQTYLFFIEKFVNKYFRVFICQNKTMTLPHKNVKMKCKNVQNI